MRSFVRIVLGLGLAAATSLGCNAIIGLKAPPEQDASTSTGNVDGYDATTEGSTSSSEGSVAAEAGGDVVNPNGAANGAACADGTTCASGNCADGVCCNNACAGTCEACNLAGSMGTCTGIPANTDPQMECVMITADSGAPVAVVDASAADSGDAGSASEAGSLGEAGSAEAGSIDAGSIDAGSIDASGEASSDAGAIAAINFPDSGYTSSDMKCAGSCDGKGGSGGGSCVYPDSTKQCGTQFCNEPSQAAGFVCNSAGSCTLGFTSCAAYSCVGSACGTSCTQESDCLPRHYCDSTTSTCKPTFGNGVSCTSPNECTSGSCTVGGQNGAQAAGRVCCSSDCTIQGGTCLKGGAVGECECQVACDGGACQVFYQDADGDGYGNMNGDPTPPSVTAYIGCSNSTIRTGYVADHTDCDDQDPLVNPGQTQYFATKSTGPAHTFDYNCDGTLEKGTQEFPGQSCDFCNATPTCGATAATCTSVGEQAALGCGPRRICVITKCPVGVFCIPKCSVGGCYPTEGEPGVAAFSSTVNCGAAATATACGTCGAVGEAAGTGTATTYLSVQQTCR